MQRLFSSFPGGGPGIGLLLLRLAAAGAAIPQGAVCLARSTDLSTATCVSAVLLVLSGIAVLIGLMTPGTAVLLGAAITLFRFLHPPDSAFVDAISASLIAVTALAIALLGPGAYSIDARLFGRREIVISRESQARRS